MMTELEDILVHVGGEDEEWEAEVEEEWKGEQEEGEGRTTVVAECLPVDDDIECYEKGNNKD